MSTTATMTTTTSEAPKASGAQGIFAKSPMIFSIDSKNETLFKIKQVSTFVHFISLMVLMVMVYTGHEYKFKSFVVAATSFTLAIFIPPTGLVNPDNGALGADYAKNAMGWSPYTQIEREAAAREAAKKEKEAKKGGKRGKKNK